jgi:hypothetical protein
MRVSHRMASPFGARLAFKHGWPSNDFDAIRGRDVDRAGYYVKQVFFLMNAPDCKLIGLQLGFAAVQASVERMDCLWLILGQCLNYSLKL